MPLRSLFPHKFIYYHWVNGSFISTGPVGHSLTEKNVLKFVLKKVPWKHFHDSQNLRQGNTGVSASVRFKNEKKKKKLLRTFGPKGPMLVLCFCGESREELLFYWPNRNIAGMRFEVDTCGL